MREKDRGVFFDRNTRASILTSELAESLFEGFSGRIVPPSIIKGIMNIVIILGVLALLLLAACDARVC